MLVADVNVLDSEIDVIKHLIKDVFEGRTFLALLLCFLFLVHKLLYDLLDKFLLITL